MKIKLPHDIPHQAGGLIYTGGGFLPGVPARDLPGAEAERYGRDILIMTGLYAEPDEPTKEGEE